MEEQQQLTNTIIERALVKVEQQRKRIQPKLDHANAMFDRKLRELRTVTAGLERWDRKCRYYARQLALVNSGMLLTKKPKQPKGTRRAIDL